MLYGYHSSHSDGRPHSAEDRAKGKATQSYTGLGRGFLWTLWTCPRANRLLRTCGRVSGDHEHLYPVVMVAECVLKLGDGSGLPGSDRVHLPIAPQTPHYASACGACVCPRTNRLPDLANEVGLAGLLEVPQTDGVTLHDLGRWRTTVNRHSRVHPTARGTRSTRGSDYGDMDPLVETKHVTVGGARVACQIAGDGPENLVICDLPVLNKR
jgi:hypothetical protein